MKNIAQRSKKRAESFNIDNPLMFRRGAHGCFEGVRLAGRNAGAKMILRHGGNGGGGGLQDSCSINIYICNNVQGVNNSVVVGSEVKQRDPGVRLYLKGLKLDKGFQKTHKKKTSWELVGGICWITSFLLIAFIFLFLVM